jgi:cell division initiation protein
MRLTPLDIRKQEFTRAFRGYDADEVLAFLQMLSSQWEDLLDENRRRDEKIRDLENKMAHYEKVEEALQEALQTARETSREALQNAQEKARLILDSAQKRAEDITRDAEQDRHQIKREAAKLSGRRSEIVTRLRAFLMSEMELLARFEGDDPIGFIKLLPADERTQQRFAADATSSLDVDMDEVEGEFQQPTAGSDESSPRVRYGRTDVETDNAETLPADDSDSHDAGGATGDSDDEFLSIPEEQPTSRAHGADQERRNEGEIDSEGVSDEATGNRGWTTRTVVSRPSDYTSPPADEADDLEDANSGKGTRNRASSEEIEKIRRILSGLD